MSDLIFRAFNSFNKKKSPWKKNMLPLLIDQLKQFNILCDICSKQIGFMDYIPHLLMHYKQKTLKELLLKDDYTSGQEYYEIAMMFKEGKELIENLHIANYFFDKGAQKGNSDAQYEIGDNYFTGKGVTRDYIKAFHYFTLSEQQNNPKGINGVGVCYQKGFGVKMNIDNAFKSYLRASQEGSIKAYCNIGNLYKNGYLSTGKDLAQAYKFYQFAADKGFPKGKLEIGRAYLQGLHYKQDLKLAKEYLIAALRSGEEDAAALLKQIKE